MYALMSQWQMDESRFDELVPVLHARIIPMVEQTPGFIEGYWAWDHSNGKTADLIAYETEEQARALKSFIERDSQEHPVEGVRFEAARVLELIGHARKEAPAGAAS